MTIVGRLDRREGRAGPAGAALLLIPAWSTGAGDVGWRGLAARRGGPRRRELTRRPGAALGVPRSHGRTATAPA